jgi:hypothetical protein
MRALPRLLPLVLAAALAGCAQQQTSATDFKGSEKAVAEAVEDLQANAQGRKAAAICSDDLSRELADKLKTARNDCTAEMEKITGDADDYELKVTDVTVTGTTATATVETRRGSAKKATRTYRLTREDDAWRLADLGT